MTKETKRAVEVKAMEFAHGTGSQHGFFDVPEEAHSLYIATFLSEVALVLTRRSAEVRSARSRYLESLGES